MEVVFECLMIAAFCAAIAVQLLRCVKNLSCASKEERFALITIEIGFVIGAVSKIFSTAKWVVIFYALGAMLTYAALLFSAPQRKTGKGIKIRCIL